MPNLSDTNNLRKIVTLHFSFYDFLMEVYQRAASQGLVHPDEMIVAGHTWNQLKQAQTIQLQPPAVEEPAGEAAQPPQDPPPMEPPHVDPS